MRSGSASQQSYNGAGACSASGISSWPGIGGGQRRGPQAARRVGTALFRAAPASCVAPSPWAAATFGASKQNQPFAFSGNPSTYASESTQSSARGFGSLDQQEASLSASQKVAAAEHIASMRAGAAASPVPAASSSPADETPIAQLSRIRETEGFWEPSVELAKLLISKRLGANEPGQGAIFAHSELPPRVWATVLVLAWLHKHAQPDRGLWTSMWDKAFSWLQVCPYLQCLMLPLSKLHSVCAQQRCKALSGYVRLLACLLGELSKQDATTQRIQPLLAHCMILSHGKCKH